MDWEFYIALYRSNILHIVNNLSTRRQITCNNGLIKLFSAILGAFIEIKCIIFAKNQNISTETKKKTCEKFK